MNLSAVIYLAKNKPKSRSSKYTLIASQVPGAANWMHLINWSLARLSASFPNNLKSVIVQEVEMENLQESFQRLFEKIPGNSSITMWEASKVMQKTTT